MSMSEFEEQSNSWEQCSTPFSTQGLNLPGDFSDEDEAFAKELGTLFALDKEVLPPYFVQTLLDSEEPRFQPVEYGLEHKTCARVFRRLRLRHQIFNMRRSPVSSFFTLLPMRGSLIVGAVLILCMFLTVMFTAPSFATGMDLLLHGAKIGVRLVQSYPAGVKSSHSANTSDSTGDIQPKLTFQAALQQLHDWTIYWPQAIPNTYTLDGTYLYQGQQQDWVDGPFVELDYSLTGAPSHGTGLLAIREFKLQPDVNVLQIVKDGAAQTIKINQNGGVQAIYVDGQWVRHNRFFHVWVYGQRSELIYQKDGIIFWIVGDQRDGMGKNALLNIANSLQVFPLTQYIRSDKDSTTDMVTLVKGDVDGPFTGNLLAIYPDDSGTSTYLSLGSTEQTSSETATPKAVHKAVHRR